MREQILSVLRRYWPEPSEDFSRALKDQATCADAIMLELGFCPKDGDSMPCTTCGAGL